MSVAGGAESIIGELMNNIDCSGRSGHEPKAEAGALCIPIQPAADAVHEPARSAHFGRYQPYPQLSLRPCVMPCRASRMQCGRNLTA